MREEEIERLIERVSENFERSFDIRIDPSARRALLLPALPHLSQVQRDQITIRQLEMAVLKILSNAMDIEHGVSFIDERAVQLSMERDCPYLFWC